MKNINYFKLIQPFNNRTSNTHLKFLMFLILQCYVFVGFAKVDTNDAGIANTINLDDDNDDVLDTDENTCTNYFSVFYDVDNSPVTVDTASSLEFIREGTSNGVVSNFSIVLEASGLTLMLEGNNRWSFEGLSRTTLNDAITNDGYMEVSLTSEELQQISSFRTFFSTLYTDLIENRTLQVATNPAFTTSTILSDVVGFRNGTGFLKEYSFSNDLILNKWRHRRI